MFVPYVDSPMSTIKIQFKELNANLCTSSILRSYFWLYDIFANVFSNLAKFSQLYLAAYWGIIFTQTNGVSMKVLLYLSFFIVSVAQGGEFSSWDPSFDCKKAQTDVEKMICEENSYKLKQLDNVLNIYYRKLKSGVDDFSTIKVKQKQWLKIRNKCLTKKCIENAYELREYELKQQLIKTYTAQNTQCNKDELTQIFSFASTLGTPQDVAKNLSIYEARNQIIDIDQNGTNDILFSIEETAHCGGKNCMLINYATLDIDGCYKSIPFGYLRSYAISINETEKRIQEAYSKGDYVDGFAVIGSYNIDGGCAGSTGTTTYDALSKTTLGFETFVWISQKCSKEISFSTKFDH